MARRPTISRQRKRHNNSWAAVIFSAFVTVPAASKVLLGTLVLSNPGIDETILRVVGNVVVESDQVGAAES